MLQTPPVAQHVSVDFTVGFRNPYGYLPGLQYGLLPFYGVLFVAYRAWAEEEQRGHDVDAP